MMTPFKNEADYYGFDIRECATAIADLFNSLNNRYGVNKEPLTAEDVSLASSISGKWHEAGGPFGGSKPDIDMTFNFRRCEYQLQTQYPGETPYFYDTHLVGAIKKLREVTADKGFGRETALCDQLYGMLKSRDPFRYKEEERERD